MEGQPSADFISCVALGSNGEFAEKYFRKGVKIVVVGSWQTGSYTNKEGNKVYTNECLVEGCEFAESKAASDGGNSGNAGQAHNFAANDGFMNIPDGIDEELPFN